MTELTAKVMPLVDSRLLDSATALLKDVEGNGALQFPLGEAWLLQRTEPTTFEGVLYRPVVCHILQGAKHVVAGDIRADFQTGHTCIVSHELPVLSQITQASPDAPYIAFILPIDLELIRGFYDKAPDFATCDAPKEAISSEVADPGLLDVIARYLEIVHDDRGASLLGPILLREIHARVLLSPQGAILCRYLQRDDPSNHVSQAISLIQASIESPLSVSDLAEQVGMSRSSFHAHFRSVTGLSPGQYQKDIRLLEAQRLLHQGDLAISSIAFEVGYESPAQFSRDYTRKFGLSPREDRKLGRRLSVMQS